MPPTKPKRLLFLAYPFPPSTAIGAVRTWGMAKYLARLGWEITVITPSPEGRLGSAECEETAHQCQQEGIKRIFAGELDARRTDSAAVCLSARAQQYRLRFLRRLYRFFGFGLEDRWWRSCLAASAAMTRGHFDLVLATGSPFTTFFAAMRIARRLAVPYVLDYRDPWSLSVHGARWLRFCRWPLESAVLHDAAYVLTVSSSLAQSQASAFRLPHPPMVLTNGFDPEQMPPASSTARQNDFTVVYAGSFYRGQREIDPIVKAIRIVSAIRHPDQIPIRLHYYGSQSEHVQESARRQGATDLVVCHGRVQRSEVLAALRSAGCAVVIASIRDTASAVERGIVTGKLFELLGLGIPVLLVAPVDSDASAILAETGSGSGFQASQTAAMAEWLVACREGTGQRRYCPPVAYSWPILAENLNCILTRVIDEGKQSCI